MQMKKPSTNPSLSQFGDTFRNGSEVLSKSTATVKKLIANNLKHHLLDAQNSYQYTSVMLQKSLSDSSNLISFEISYYLQPILDYTQTVLRQMNIHHTSS